MPKITSEQINSVNSKCSNDWCLNVLYYSGYGEKTLIKRIRLDEQNFLEFTLSYNSNNQITLRISKYTHKAEDTMAVSEGLGKTVILDETKAKRKSVNNLIEQTTKLTDEKLLDINKTAKVSTGYGIMQESTDF